MSIRKSKLALAIGLVVALPTSAFATNGILQAGNGIVAHGMGGAGLANAGEAAAGMDNPALISQTGDSVSLGWSIFMPKRTVDATAVGGQSVNSDSPMFAIPQGAFTAKFNDNINWGVMAYAMGGMNTDYGTGPFGGNPQSVNLEGLVVAPTMSYAFSNNLSAGVSVLIAKETFTVRNLFGTGSAGTFEGSAMGYGAKLGVDYKITNGIAVAATVQPKLSMGKIDAFQNFLQSGFGFTGNSQLTLPDEYGIGGKFGVGSNVDVVADLMYYAWNSVDLYKFFGWKSEPVLKVGAEFRPTDKWALRAGINYGKSPIQGGNAAGPGGTMDAAFANYPFPAISEGHITIGAGYKLEKNLTVNGYYLYAPKVTETATMGPAPGTKISMSQNAAGLDMNYSF